MSYNWQHPRWPDFEYDLKALGPYLQKYMRELGRLEGLQLGLPQDERQSTLIEMMATEAMNTSAIDGELIKRSDVVSSIKRHFGMPDNSSEAKDLRAKGIAAVLADMRKSFDQPLTTARLFDWHKELMTYKPHVQGRCWRQHDEPMQVVSGVIGRETVHFEAPPSSKIAHEMTRFIEWFNYTAPGQKHELQAPIRASIAHLYFESIHPFEDGNGRIGRVIAEKAFIHSIGSPLLFSLSAAIEQDKTGYYTALKAAQRSLVIDQWHTYFLDALTAALENAQQVIAFTLSKVHFFDRFNDRFNPRQLKVIRRMFAAGYTGFEGGMTATKYMRITGTSKATATRDLQKLHRIGALKVEGKGRATRYALFLSSR